MPYVTVEMFEAWRCTDPKCSGFKEGIRHLLKPGHVHAYYHGDHRHQTTAIELLRTGGGVFQWLDRIHGKPVFR